MSAPLPAPHRPSRNRRAFVPRFLMRIARWRRGPLRHGLRRAAARLLAAALALAPAAAGAQGAGLDRLTLRDQLLGWEAVGRVDIAGGGFCTGTLIAPDLVLTAAHCLFGPAHAAPVDPGRVTFRSGLRDGQAVAAAPVARAVPHPGYLPAADGSLDRVRHDVALLQLARPIPAAVAAPFAVRPSDGVRAVSVVSYARERAEALSWERSCTIVGRDSGLMAFDCDVHFGSSGAPVFDLSGGRGRIVSLIVGGRRDAGGTLSVGMELPAAVAALHEALRRGEGVAEAAVPPAQTRAQPLLRRPGAGGDRRDIGARFLRP